MNTRLAKKQDDKHHKKAWTKFTKNFSFTKEKTENFEAKVKKRKKTTSVIEIVTVTKRLKKVLF